MPTLQLEATRHLRFAHPFRPRQNPRPPKRAAHPPREATHDFLVPNPRPDLTTDATMLLMLARD